MGMYNDAVELTNVQKEVFKLRPDAVAYQNLDLKFPRTGGIVIMVCKDGLYDRIAIADTDFEAWTMALKHLKERG